MQIAFQDLKKTNAVMMNQLIGTAEKVLRSGRYINGPEVESLENKLKEITCTRHCIAVSTGLDALRLIFKAYIALGKLKTGDEVIIPANTFIATYLAVTDCGLIAVAADVDENSFCLDFSKLPVTEKTRALVTVHLYGYPCWDTKKMQHLREKGILIIEDNAQAIGADFKGIKTGNLGDAAAISFYPAKNIGAFGDAGAVVTNDAKLAETVRTLANYGAREKYHHYLPGCNCRMDELQAALLNVKLQYLPQITAERRKTALLYNRLIENPEIKKPDIGTEEREPVWHQYVIRHPRRDQLRDFLESKGIGTEIHYPIPCHLQQCYAHGDRIRIPTPLPVVEQLANEILSLPVADLSTEETEYIAHWVNAFGR